MSKPVVLIAEELSPATVDALGPDFEIRNVDGTDRPALLAALSDAHAVLVRSATKIDAEAIAAAPSLKVVARAGVGLDNVDIKAATTAGVMVVNAPTSNIISAAELTVGHILSLARHIPAAHASLAAGAWKRSSYTGVELYEKTVGIIGLGRIGALITQRLQAFGVTVIAYDPYVTTARAQQLGVELVSLDDLLRRADFTTIHMPRTPETLGMISDAQFALMKPTAFVVNVARGGLIDEDALHRALTSNTIAGAGLDVFVAEPPKDSPLLALPNVVVTPHLGASTDEAQEKAGVSVAKSVRLALGGELVPDAVNVAGGVIDPYVRPGIPLVEKLGQVFTALATSPVTSIDVEVHGELAEYDVSVLKLAALKGVFTDVVSDQVSYVNAPLIAEQRGVTVRLITETDSPEYRNVLTIRGAQSDGPAISVSGTLTGPKQVEKLVEINGHDVEVPLDRHHVVMEYTDRPGIVAVYGKEFGQAGINIAAMQISREAAGGQALSVLTVDSPVPAEILEHVRSAIDASSLREIDITL
ncbi:phosphoglycerate dehydrogenase [Curtobacterium sp. MCBA15_007]|uniref:phosphoglycerate dehydrogenase n=1 Tax=Curtobacterium TaxID=2034 RepID=UPI0008DDA6E4|nr:MULTISPECIES: phosphoglycerate dehydrogenase [Curtobacterium]MBT1596408.1 phosphoglycerate dehydrogenase [Curtobacterium flaccumfaciens pv. flaccumfaciens]MCS6572949.1 phosphoglycerate dehydrogenase [Curtobacterium flaccumfaciens pv. flaccumfaciens]MCS6578186.1 phosphoglycerate dehydrogenase [Curtobacterium flaccumfaciens]MCU0114006.1 phosphoglycerate dehydrogenase [Curtobacterium flaccumfaciens]MCU0153637.1 phosphoglycerate dehydrogenase [Curtobacterium flaccumfaciens pv. poinsettiae]